MQRNRTLSLLLIVSLFSQLFFATTAAAAPSPWEVRALAVDANLKPTLFPLHGTQSVVTNANLKLTFGEVVLPGTGLITLTKEEDSAFRRDINVQDPTAVQRDDAGLSIVVIPGSLTAGTYHVEVPSSAITSYTTTNEFAGIGYTDWVFRVEALLPVVTNYSPDNGYVSVDPAVQTTLSLVFSRAVTKGGAGFIQIKRATDNVTVHTIAASELTVSGTNVSGPLKGLEFNTRYYVLMDSGVIKDANNGGDYAGIPAGAWTFTTKPALDKTNPKAVAFSPANGSNLSDLNATALTIQFDKKVFANSNKSVVMRNATTNAIVCTIAAESTVGGAGSDTITININPATSACPKLVNNTKYSVFVDKDVYRDATGNYFDGTTWQFTALVDTVPPVVTVYSPAVSSTSVSTSITDFSLTFNKPLGPLLGTSKAYIYPQNNPKSTRELTMSIDPATNRVLFKLVGTAKLSPSTLYAISVPENKIQDLAGNKYSGISNPYQWTFQTGTNSTPVVSSAEIDGNIIVLNYSETLDSTKVPSAGNFYVTVNDVVTTVSGVSVSGSQVRVALLYNVLVGQTVKISYYPDGTLAARRLQSVGGVEAATFNNRVVTNNTQSTLPKPVSGQFYGNSLVLTFNRSIANLAEGALSQFTIKQNNTVIGISSAIISGTTIYLTLSTTSTVPLPVSISYLPGTGTLPMRDQSGNLVPAFTDFYVRNHYDNLKPELTSVTLNANKVVMTYNEGLSLSNVPPKNSFSIVPSGTNTTIPSITNVAVVNNTIELTLASNVAANIALLFYYYPNNPAIADLSGNIADSIVAYSFTSGSSAVSQLSTLAISGNQIALTYSTNLSATTAPYTSQYTVKYDGVTVPVTGVSVSGPQVLLTMSSSANVGQKVTVSYKVAGVSLKDYLSQAVVAFTDLVVTNNGGNGTTTPTNGKLPDFLESDGAGGQRFITDKTSTRVSAAAPSGRSTYRYMISADKFLAAYDAIKPGSGVNVPTITFKVPATEAAALVGIPLRAVVDAASKASNTSFQLDFGDLKFDLPLKAINYNKQLQEAGGDISSAYLLLNIEKVATTPISTSIAGKGGALITSAANFTASILAGGKEREVESYETYVTRTFVLSSANGVPSNQIAVVRIDPDSGEVTYVPTNVRTTSAGANVSFKRKGNSVYAAIRSNIEFSDMTKHWAKNEVTLLASKYIVRGSTLTAYSPTRAITRSEFAEYIARGLGLSGNSQAAKKFKDVGVSHKKASYIGAVSEAGIVEGGTDGRFRPDAQITREEMATILVRAMKYAGVAGDSSSSALNGFKDKAKVSSWAKSGMETCVSVGFIQGSTTKTINPQSNATRAEAAIMIKRFLEYVEFL
ncbi:SwmB domain-containing protein [Cohnella terricola]|uniref:SLH domain-containing protein n=1 Tax=Cohnella terricola TaxID=1289167 RepID=A0A559JB08_9BACL|nr:SwmB domain-containing protein [Cohnella terricola]TVX97056.1 hypothetical protein FPZ45_19025 [Cohnella terricola]